MWESLTLLVNWWGRHTSVTLIALPMMHRKALHLCLSQPGAQSPPGKKNKASRKLGLTLTASVLRDQLSSHATFWSQRRWSPCSLPPPHVPPCHFGELCSMIQERKKCIDSLFARSQIVSLTLFYMLIFLPSVWLWKYYFDSISISILSFLILWYICIL